MAMLLILKKRFVKVNSKFNIIVCNDPLCLSCDLNDVSKCLECTTEIDKLILDPDTRKCICSSGYYLSDKVCRTCNIFCSECTGPTNKDCVPKKCANGAYPVKGAETNCLYMCETPSEDLYIDKKDKMCKQCVYPCKSCFSDDDESCTSCKDDYLLYGNTCRKDCLVGTYKEDGACFPCDPKCNACVNRVNYCIDGCKDDYYYKNHRCLDDCGEGYTVLDKNCEPCDTGCSECTYEKSVKICLNCNVGKYLFNNNCLDSCPLGFYPDNTVGKCIPCNEACAHCFGGSNKNCYSCNSELGFIMIAENICNYPSCTDGSYFNITQRTCVSCPKECSKCYGALNCTECIEGYNFDYLNKKCYNPCDKPGFTRKANSLECEEICGDGKNMGKHECDDGNTRNGDGCNSKCKVEAYYECSGGTPYNPDICIYRKPADVISFKYSADRSALITFDTRLRLLESLEDIIEFTVTKVEDSSVKWSYDAFNKNRFTSIKFKFEFSYSLTGIEVIFHYRR